MSGQSLKDIGLWFVITIVYFSGFHFFTFYFGVFLIKRGIATDPFSATYYSLLAYGLLTGIVAYLFGSFKMRKESK